MLRLFSQFHVELFLYGLSYKSLMLQEALFATGGARQLNPHCLSLAFCGRRGTALGKIQMGTEEIRAVLLQGLAAL